MPDRCEQIVFPAALDDVDRIRIALRPGERLHAGGRTMVGPAWMSSRKGMDVTVKGEAVRATWPASAGIRRR
jgi:hypothetical protein